MLIQRNDFVQVETFNSCFFNKDIQTGYHQKKLQSTYCTI